MGAANMYVVQTPIIRGDNYKVSELGEGAITITMTETP